jgi:hypothetical protein
MKTEKYEEQPLIQDERARTCPNTGNWLPRWIVEVRPGERLGIGIDDDCLVVLYPFGTSWRPGTHIPRAVAARFAEFSASLPDE